MLKTILLAGTIAGTLLAADGASAQSYSPYSTTPNPGAYAAMMADAARSSREAAQNALNGAPYGPCKTEVANALAAGEALNGDTVQQRLTQCEQQIQAQREQAEQARRDQAERARQQAELQADKVEQAREQALAETQARDAARRLEMAETSPNNSCKDPDVARQLIMDFNNLSKGRVEAVDIEHLTTNVGVTADRSCHGVFVLTNGLRLEGNLSYRQNVAGDPIVRWVDGGAPSLPPLPASPIHVVDPTPVPVDTPKVQPVSTQLAPQGDSMVQKGLSDRTSWETWFNGLQGDEKTGAFYWAGQRSLSHPGSCQQMSAAFYNGCTAAKTRLAASDAMRKFEPSYKLGWNSYTAQ